MSQFKQRQNVEGRERTHLDILYEIVEHAQTLWVLAVLHIDERADLCGLRSQSHRQQKSSTSCSSSTHLERNVVVPEPNFQLLLANNVLLRPVCVVFPTIRVRNTDEKLRRRLQHALDDFAHLDDALELLHHERSKEDYFIRSRPQENANR